jgi:hypothetical protein
LTDFTADLDSFFEESCSPKHQVEVNEL